MSTVSLKRTAATFDLKSALDRRTDGSKKLGEGYSPKGWHMFVLPEGFAAEPTR